MTHGCKCAQCYSLTEYLSEHGHDTRGLPPAPGHQAPAPLKLVQAHDTTTILAVPDVCDGSMTCDCVDCQQDRANRIRNPRSHARQPWDVRPAA